MNMLRQYAMKGSMLQWFTVDKGYFYTILHKNL